MYNEGAVADTSGDRFLTSRILSTGTIVSVFGAFLI